MAAGLTNSCRAQASSHIQSCHELRRSSMDSSEKKTSGVSGKYLVRSGALPNQNKRGLMVRRIDSSRSLSQASLSSFSGCESDRQKMEFTSLSNSWNQIFSVSAVREKILFGYDSAVDRVDKESRLTQEEYMQTSLSIGTTFFKHYQGKFGACEEDLNQFMLWMEKYPEKQGLRVLKCLKDPHFPSILEWIAQESELNLRSCTIQEVYHFIKRQRAQLKHARAQLKDWHYFFVGLSLSYTSRIPHFIQYYKELQRTNRDLMKLFCEDLVFQYEDSSTQPSSHFEISFDIIIEIAKVEKDQEILQDKVSDSCTYMLIKMYMLGYGKRSQVEKPPFTEVDGAIVNPMNEMIKGVLPQLCHAKLGFMWRCFDEVLLLAGHKEPEEILKTLLLRSGEGDEQNFLCYVMAVIQAEDQAPLFLYDDKTTSLGSRLLNQFTRENFSFLLRQVKEHRIFQSYKPLFARIYGVGIPQSQENLEITRGYIEQKHADLTCVSQILEITFSPKDSTSGGRTSSKSKESPRVVQEVKVVDPNPFFLSFSKCKNTVSCRRVPKEKEEQGFPVRSSSSGAISRIISRGKLTERGLSSPRDQTGFTEGGISIQYMDNIFSKIETDRDGLLYWHRVLCHITLGEQPQLDTLSNYHHLMLNKVDKRMTYLLAGDILEWLKGNSNAQPLSVIGKIGDFERKLVGEKACSDTLAYALFKAKLESQLDSPLSKTNKKIIISKDIFTALLRAESVSLWLCYEELSRRLDISDVYRDIVLLYEADESVELLKCVRDCIEIEDRDFMGFASVDLKFNAGSRLLEEYLKSYFRDFIEAVAITTGDELAKGAPIEETSFFGVLRRMMIGDEKEVEGNIEQIIRSVKVSFAEEPHMIFQIISLFMALEEAPLLRGAGESVSEGLFNHCVLGAPKEQFFEYLSTDREGVPIALHFFFRFKQHGLKEERSSASTSQKELVPVKEGLIHEFFEHVSKKKRVFETIELYLQEEVPPQTEDLGQFRRQSIAVLLWIKYCNGHLGGYLGKIGLKYSDILKHHFSFVIAKTRGFDLEKDRGCLRDCMQDLLNVICVKGPHREELPDEIKVGLRRIAGALYASENIQNLCKRKDRDLTRYVRQLTASFLFLRIIVPYLRTSVFANPDESTEKERVASKNLNTLLTKIGGGLTKLANNSTDDPRIKEAHLKKTDFDKMNGFLDELIQLSSEKRWSRGSLPSIRENSMSFPDRRRVGAGSGSSSSIKSLGSRGRSVSEKQRQQ